VQLCISEHQFQPRRGERGAGASFRWPTETLEVEKRVTTKNKTIEVARPKHHTPNHRLQRYYMRMRMIASACAAVSACRKHSRVRGFGHGCASRCSCPPTNMWADLWTLAFLALFGGLDHGSQSTRMRRIDAAPALVAPGGAQGGGGSFCISSKLTA